MASLLEGKKQGMHSVCAKYREESPLPLVLKAPPLKVKGPLYSCLLMRHFSSEIEHLTDICKPSIYIPEPIFQEEGGVWGQGYSPLATIGVR